MLQGRARHGLRRHVDVVWLLTCQHSLDYVCVPQSVAYVCVGVVWVWCVCVSVSVCVRACVCVCVCGWVYVCVAQLGFRGSGLGLRHQRGGPPDPPTWKRSCTLLGSDVP